MRKKKIAGVLSVMLSLCLASAALSGCGNQAATSKLSASSEEEVFRGGGKGRALEAYLKEE